MLAAMDILTETQNLWQRFQRGGAFRVYLRDRLRLVVPALVIFVAFSVATTAGTVITLGGTRSFLVLVGLLTAPFILIGSLYAQLLTFFLWLENRAIARATHHAAHTRKQELADTLAGLLTLGRSFSPIVVAVGAALLLVPLAFLAYLSAEVAFLLLVVVAATPFAYALLDR
jgi:hypothetical protein